MFHLACIFYIVIVIYSLIYHLRTLINYKKNRKIKIKDGSGLFVAKEILNKNNIGTLYVTKINSKYKDHYNIGRNVIKLSSEVYDEENLASLTIAFYLVIKALVFQDNKKRKENNIKFLATDLTYKISFIMFIFAATFKDWGSMIICLGLMIGVIIFRYSYIEKYNKLIEMNISYLKRVYKLKYQEISSLKKTLKTLVLKELFIN